MSEPTVAALQAALAEQDSRPGDGVTMYVFAKGEAVSADHPAVKACPHLFEALEDEGEV